MNKLCKLITATAIIPLSVFCTLSQAATISFSGQISIVYENNGGMFGGISPGDTVSATHTYPDSELAAFFIDPQPNQTYWDFTGAGNSGVLNVGDVSPVDLSFTTVSVRDNDAFTNADFLDAAFNSLYTPPISNGTLIDGWQVAGTTADDSIGFGLFMTSLDTSLYSDMSYQPLAPATGDVDYTAFVIIEEDSFGNTLFFAVGTVASINNVSTVPVPAAVWLFGSGLIGLIGIARRKKA